MLTLEEGKEDEVGGGKVGREEFFLKKRWGKEENEGAKKMKK